MALDQNFKHLDIREALENTHMRGRNITFLDDFSRDEIQSLFQAAQMLEPFMRTGTDLSRARSGQSFALALAAMGAKIIYTGTSELRTPEVVRQKLIKMNANFEEHFDLTMKQNEELYAEKNVDLIYLPGCSVKKDDPNRADFEKKMANYYVSLEMLRNIKAKTGKTVGVHHSLPRNPGEFNFGIDNTEHQLYFRAIGFSVALRMALLAAVVGVN